MTLYTRNDDGVIRCAECDVRFGEVRDGHALIDVGWKVVERKMPRFADRVITIQEHNLPKFQEAVGRGTLQHWRAKRKTDKRRGDNKRGASKQSPVCRGRFVRHTMDRVPEARPATD